MLYTFDKEYYYDLARFHEKTGNYAEALSNYRKVEAAIPYLVKPKCCMAKLYHGMGDTASFRAKAKAALEVRPKVFNAEIGHIQRELNFLLKQVEKAAF